MASAPRLTLWLCVWIAAATAIQVPSRRNCRLHFLGGERTTAVLPLQSQPGAPVSNVVCVMPSSDMAPVVTEVHSGLEQPMKIYDRRTVQFQVVDLTLLKEMTDEQRCTQTVTVEWDEQPNPMRSAFELLSVLNESSHFEYEGVESKQYLLEGRYAGIRHIIPEEDAYPKAARIKVSELRCEHDIIPHHKCHIQGKVDIEFSPPAFDSSYEFAFRTDVSDQTLFSLHTAERSGHVRLEHDLFLAVDSQPLVSVGQLSDARWHTARIHFGNQVTVSIDGQPGVEVRQIGGAEQRVKEIEVKLSGEVLLIDRDDELEACAESGRRRVTTAASTRELCSSSECGCPILSDVFDGLTATACANDETGAYQFLRDPSRLSFFFLPDSIEPSEPGRWALSFRSDSDSGLLLFGSWQLFTGRGRMQVHYHGERMTAFRCVTEDGAERCEGCSLTRNGGFSSSSWHRVAFFQLGDVHHLLLDGSSCQLRDADMQGLDVAEMYTTPSLSQGSALFVGGMYYKKTKPGIYKSSLSKYFDNTHEKLPSLRGCVKDVFVAGKRVNLLESFQKQITATLVDSGRTDAYAITMGCGSCGGCPRGARCRPSSVSPTDPFVCDCSDIGMFAREGKCVPGDDSVIALSPSRLLADPVTIPVNVTRSLLSKVWLRIKLASETGKQEQTVVELHSHHDTILRLLISPTHSLIAEIQAAETVTRVEKLIAPSDSRIHQVVLQRRTPLGTRPNARFFDLTIDGQLFTVPDDGRRLTSIVVRPAGEESEASCIHDFGISYDFDEQSYVTDPRNRIQQIDGKALLQQYVVGEMEGREQCGILDPYLWERSPDGLETSEYGQIIGYQPEIVKQAMLLHSQWLLYSLIVAAALALLVLLCCCYYCCFVRGRGKKKRFDDEEAMMRGSSSGGSGAGSRASPDGYRPVVVLRRPNDAVDRDSFISQNSMDKADISAYDDIKTHKVKVDRESMVSFLEPVAEPVVVSEAIVRKNDDAPLVDLTAED